MNKAPVWAWPVIVMLSVAVAVLARVTPIGDAGRAIAEGWFLLVCPGIALVPLLQLDDLLTQYSMVVVVSLALDALIPTILLISGVWSPTLALSVLICVSLVGAAIQLATAPNLRRAGPPD